MPLEFRKFKKEIESNGYSVEQTQKGHYWVVTPTGGKLITFAVDRKNNEVFDSYLSSVRRAITNDQK